MSLALLFFGELFFLFLLSRQLTRSLSFLFYRWTRSKNITIYLLAALFLPGTFVHELAHYLMAVLLFVHAEGLELMPKLQENGVKLGSVQIEHTDPFRRLLIGMAPFLFGTMILLIALYYATIHTVFSNFWFVLLLGYLVFEIGNTMFSSRKDMEGALELLVVVLVVVLFLFFIGFRFPIFQFTTFFSLPVVNELFTKGCLFLVAPIVIDIFVVGLLRVLRRRFTW